MNITDQEITDFLKAYEIATNTHDFANVAPLIHEEATYRFTEGDFIGIDEIAAAFRDTWNTIQDEAYVIANVTIMTADVRSASVSYTFAWSGTIDGVHREGVGRGTNILVRNGDALQSIYEHLSA